MSIKPNAKLLSDRILIQPAESEKVTSSGIIIPTQATEKPLRGTVVLAGPGNEREDMIVKEGDVVMYNKYAGTEIQVEGKDYLIMRQTDVFLVLE